MAACGSRYTTHTPFQLGAVQVLLAALGLFLAARRDLEWWYWAILSAALLLFASVWALPLWAHNDVLLAIQFPYRVLSVVGLGLALFTGGTLRRMRAGMWRTLAGALVLSAILAANLPTSIPQASSTCRGGPTPAVVARFERRTGEFGATAGWSKEFFPRWVDLTSHLTLAADKGQSHENEFTVALKSAGELALDVEVASERGGPLRLTTFFFPGWQVWLDGGARLTPYPSTNLGLLTVDVPPGAHRVEVRWAGTSVQRLATAVSLISVVALAGLCWRRRRWRQTVVPAGLLIVGLAVAAWPNPVSAVSRPQEPLRSTGVELLGYRSERASPTQFYVYPYWWVSLAQPSGLAVRWQVRDAADRVVTEFRSGPYFGTVPASNWPAQTLVDDAYAIYLPSGLAAGTYQLFAELQVPGMPAAGLTAVGPITLAQSAPTRPADSPDQLAGIRAGDRILLTGYDVSVNGRRAADRAGRPVVAHPGDTVEYTLHWRPLEGLTKDFHGLVHLLDHEGQPLVQEDHNIGEPWGFNGYWDPFETVKDRYQLLIPKTAGSGLYSAKIAVYDLEYYSKAITLLPLYTTDGTAIEDSFRLPPMKIVAETAYRPSHMTDVRLGDVGSLWGYDLSLPPEGLQPGSSFDLTLCYRSGSGASPDYTRFVHLYAAELGMAAQQDGQPGAGDNPTSSWVEGEVIVEQVHLTVDPAAKPGTYALQVGLYEPKSGQRLTAWDGAGKRLTDDQATLAQLQIGR